MMTLTMSDATTQDLARFAAEITTDAGEIAMAHFGATVSHRKADGSEVSDADLAVQTMMARRIAERYADHAVIGEETGAADSGGPDPARARYAWVIDPVDGTRNYIRHFPIFATSVAVMDRGRPVVGVIRWHHTGQLFAATAKTPTTLDGEPARVSRRPLDSNLLVGAQLGAHHATRDVVVPWLGRWAVRNLGATAIHLALVAAEGLDAAYAQDCGIWDLAAGALLVEQAGGKCTGLDGEPLFPVDPATCAEMNYPCIAGGLKAHRKLLELLATRPGPSR